MSHPPQPKMSRPAPKREFDFPSLDFTGRAVLYMHEIAARLGCSVDLVYDLADDGSLSTINLASKGAQRRELRVPIEAWHRFVLERMDGPMRASFLRSLPQRTREQLRAELAAIAD